MRTVVVQYEVRPRVFTVTDRHNPEIYEAVIEVRGSKATHHSGSRLDSMLRGLNDILGVGVSVE